jgi:thiol-disulfide isomerase/thioredoxin
MIRQQAVLLHPAHRMRAGLVSSLAVLAMIVLGACGSATASGDAGFVAGDGSLVLLDESARSPAPTWEGELLGGGTWRSADTAGEVLVINVWASWCAPCRAEAPVLEEIWLEFADQGVQFVGLDTRDTEAAALAFIERYGVTYPNIIDTDGRLQLLFSDTLPPQAIPSTLVIDREGRVAGRALGAVSASSLRGLIEPLLGPTSE